ncbi:MAG: DUF4115 domain-containing protein [Acidobacteria bacterium]|nr:DUF4115 domain-containing protein [Acidobacteriota bacterium]
MAKKSDKKTKTQFGSDTNQSADLDSDRTSVGQMLKRERTKREISLDEIVEDTKIAKMFLIALEQDELSQLPGGIYTRNFVRAYARYLGLDEDIIASQFNEQFNIKPQSVIQQERTKRDDRQFRVLQRRGVLTIGSIMALLLAVTGYLVRNSPVFNRNERPVGDVTEQESVQEDPWPLETEPALEQSAAEVTQADDDPAEVKDELETVPDDRPVTAVPQLPLAELTEITLVNASHANMDEIFAIEALDDVWVEVVVDGETVTKRILRAGELRVYRYGNHQTLRLGNVALVALQDQTEFVGQVAPGHHFLSLVEFRPGELRQSLMNALSRKDEPDGNSSRSN